LQPRQPRREGEAQLAQHAKRRVEYLAYHDGSLRLPNRSLFNRTAQSEQ